MPAGIAKPRQDEHRKPLDENASITRVWHWRITTESPRPDDLTLLSESELNRANRMRGGRSAAEYVTCRATVRRLLADFLGSEPADVPLGRRPCPGCGSVDHGPPAVLSPGGGPLLSISHSAGLGMLALSDAPVGVDVEAFRDVPVAELAVAALTPAERNIVLDAPEPHRTGLFLRCWTRKEAVLKAVGIGVTASLTALETKADRPGPVKVTTGPAHSVAATWWVTDLSVPHGWTASLASPAAGGRTITVQAL